MAVAVGGEAYIVRSRMFMDTTSFFELASLLIPVLMLSGFVTQRLRPTPLWRAIAGGHSTRTSVVQVLIVFAFGAFPATAEVAALAVTMQGGSGSTLETWVVSAAVAFGTWSLAISFVWDWIRPVWSYTKVLRVVLIVTGVFLLCSTGALLHEGVKTQRLGVLVKNLENGSGGENNGGLDDALALPYDSLLAKSQVAETLLRDQIRAASRDQRRVLRRQLRKLLVDRTDLLDKKLQSELELAADRARLGSTP